MDNLGEYSAMSESNRQKNNAGSDFDRLIKEELDALQKVGAITGYLINQNLSHPGHEYPNQYLANYIITTNEGKYIAVRSTKSFRLDRIKICYYDLDGVNRFAGFSENLVASIILVDDAELETTSFVNTRERFRSGEYYCPATHLFALSEFLNFLREYKYNALYSETDEEEADYFEDLLVAEPSGSAYGRAGNKLEKILSEMLSDYNYLRQFKSSSASVPMPYALIMNKLILENKISVDEIIRVKASNSIPLLNSGGNSKTDILVFIDLESGITITETISIKNTTSSRVSCHDYTIDDYIRVLDVKNSRVEEYIRWFGEAGSAKGLVELLPYGYSLVEFEKDLSEVVQVLIEWALTGAHDEQNLVNSELQISRYLLIRKQEEIRFYSMHEYFQKLKQRTGTFGTPLSWTYPSKQLGKRIQLKVPIILD